MPQGRFSASETAAWLEKYYRIPSSADEALVYLTAVGFDRTKCRDETPGQYVLMYAVVALSPRCSLYERAKGRGIRKRDKREQDARYPIGQSHHTLLP